MNDSQFPEQDEFIIDDIMTVFLASVSILSRLCDFLIHFRDRIVGKTFFQLRTFLAIE